MLAAILLLSFAAFAGASGRPAASASGHPRHAAPPAAARPLLAVPGAPDPPRRDGRRAPAPPPPPQRLDDLLARVPADSLARPLHQFELDHVREREGADAAFALGQLHYARGEYRQAADDFSRAAARFSPQRKPEARYWQGMSALGGRDAIQARSALEEVAQGGSPRAEEARLGVAMAWEQAGRADRAIEVLQTIVNDEPNEATPSALEQLANLSARSGDDDGARRASERLRREYPESIEAMRLPAPPPAPPERTVRRRDAVGVQIGAFADPERARALLDAAKRAGFERAELVTQGRGEARLHVVRVGWFAGEPEARRVGEQASRELGVAYRLVRP